MTFKILTLITLVKFPLCRKKSKFELKKKFNQMNLFTNNFFKLLTSHQLKLLLTNTNSNKKFYRIIINNIKFISITLKCIWARIYTTLLFETLAKYDSVVKEIKN